MRWHMQPSLHGAGRDWLLDPDSLTQKLVSHSAGDFRVQRIAEGRIFTTPGYPLPGGGLAHCNFSQGFGLYWQREVALIGRGRPWVLALTLVPCQHQALTRRLRLLKNRPLGNFLFQQPGLQRLRMDFAATDLGHARRSWFRLNQQDMVLIELFRNDFLDAL